MDTYAQRSDMYNATKYLYNPQKETNAYMKKSIATIENITTQFVFLSKSVVLTPSIYSTIVDQKHYKHHCMNTDA